ncbi:MAG: glycosyltransferase [Candidatus Thorarchaeota archaeon]
MIRVAMISPLPPQRTGEAPYTARLIKSIVRSGEVRVMAYAGEEANPIQTSEDLVETFAIWKGRSLTYPFVLMKHINEKRPHLVHVQFGPHGKVYGGMFGEVMLVLLILLRLVGIRTTVTLHSTWMPWQVKARIKKRRILGRFAFLASPLFRLYMWLFNKGTSTVQLSTVREDSMLKKQFLKTYRFDPEKVLEIPHPCSQADPTRTQKASADSMGLRGRRVILVFGFIRPGKGLDIAVRAMVQIKEALPDVVLLIAGRPQSIEGRRQLDEIHSLVLQLDLQTVVRFDTRFIPEEEVPGYFDASTLLLVPYTESVGASGPIHGYAGYGVPILASDAGYHNRESLGGNLFLFRAGDPNDLSKKLIEVLSSPELRTTISKKQLEYVRRETWNLAAMRTLRNYKKTLR